jgi:hypothetical protein
MNLKRFKPEDFIKEIESNNQKLSHFIPRMKKFAIRYPNAHVGSYLYIHGDDEETIGRPIVAPITEEGIIDEGKKKPFDGEISEPFVFLD